MEQDHAVTGSRMLNVSFFRLICFSITALGISACASTPSNPSSAPATPTSGGNFCEQRHGSGSELQWVIYQETISLGAPSKGVGGFRCSIKASDCRAPASLDKSGKCQSEKYPLKVLCASGELESRIGKTEFVSVVCGQRTPAKSAQLGER